MPEPPSASNLATSGAAKRFRLLRYYMLATLVAFATVAVVLVVLQRREEVFFDQTQRQQRAFFAQAQATLAAQHADAARSSLLSVHEAAHVTLTRLVANMLWDSHIAPYVEQARAVPAGPCGGGDAEQRRACARERGRALRALPGFQALDRNAYQAMRTTSVFKIKVFDLRGLTVYSSEHAQIGEDASPNAGWRLAAAGRPASELTHRDRFSAFERVVEDRDLISTYVPVRRTGDETPVGVVELYSDVTPFLARIRETIDQVGALTRLNEAAVAARSDENNRAVEDSSTQFLLIVLGLLALLYAAGLFVVHRGQQLIDRQARAQALAAQREQQWHHEKMAALATMAANVSHEVGNPLTVIAGIAHELPEAQASGSASAAARILAQTQRMATMMRQITDFAAARGTEPDWIDVNALVKSVCDFHAFDRRYRDTTVNFTADPELPACRVAPDLLNEVVMGLLQSCSEAAASPDHRPSALQVCTRHEGANLLIEVGNPAIGPGLEACPRLLPARQRMAQMGGELVLGSGTLMLRLPIGND